MQWHVIVEQPVSQAIRGFGLPRDVLLRLLNTLHDQLARRYPQLRSDRDPEDTDCFLYRVTFVTRDRWWRFYFRVNDTRAPEHLFVETVAHKSRPLE